MTSEKSKLSHFRNLVYMAAMDERIADDELDYLEVIGKRLGLSDEQIQEYLSNPGQLRFKTPESKDAKFNQLWDLIRVMIADQEVHEEELEFCHMVGELLGFDEEKIDIIVQDIIQSISKDQNREDVKEQLKKYL